MESVNNYLLPKSTVLKLPNQKINLSLNLEMKAIYIYIYIYIYI